jgi:hypothetical protein
MNFVLDDDKRHTKHLNVVFYSTDIPSFEFTFGPPKMDKNLELMLVFFPWIKRPQIRLTKKMFQQISKPPTNDIFSNLFVATDIKPNGVFRKFYK